MSTQETNKSNVRVLLINPPITTTVSNPHVLEPPLGLAYLAAVLERDGFKVKILDAFASGVRNIKRNGEYIRVGMDDDSIKDYISDFSPQIVGISAAYTSVVRDSHYAARLVKEVNNEALVVFGGAHATVCAEEVLSDSNVDMVVKGEGEITFLDIARNLTDKAKLFSLPGTIVRHENHVLSNPNREYIEDLDSLPFPAYHLLPMEVYLHKSLYHTTDWAMRPPRLNMVTSRGCPGRCVFCSIHGVWGFGWRARSPGNVIDEIEWLKKTWNIGEVAFQDDNITLDRNRMIGICDEIIKRKLNLRWCTPNGVAIWTLDEDLVKKMRQSGCWRLSFGIESAWPDTQKFIGKRVPLEKVNKIIKAANDSGIWTHGTFVIGFPFEPLESIKATIDYAANSELDFAHVYIASPYPGTRLNDIVNEEHLLPQGVGSWSVNKAEWDTKFVTRDELNRLRAEAFSLILSKRMRRFVNPVRLMGKVKSWEDFRFIFRLIFRAIKMRLSLRRSGELLTHWSDD